MHTMKVMDLALENRLALENPLRSGLLKDQHLVLALARRLPWALGPSGKTNKFLFVHRILAANNRLLSIQTGLRLDQLLQRFLQ